MDGSRYSFSSIEVHHLLYKKVKNFPMHDVGTIGLKLDDDDSYEGSSLVDLLTTSLMEAVLRACGTFEICQCVLWGWLELTTYDFKGNKLDKDLSLLIHWAAIALLGVDN